MGDSWVPIDKEVRSLLPKKGPFSAIDAMISLQLDFNENKPVSVAGYANLWGWSRDKVRRFLSDRRVEIVYPEDTKSKQNQRGYIKKTDQKTDNRQIKKQIELIDINELKEKSNRSKNRKPTDTQVTTSNPINPYPLKDIVVQSSGQGKEGKDKDLPPFGEIISYLNTAINASKPFLPTTKETMRLINARWRQGRTLDDFKLVIDAKTAQWLNSEKMRGNLRPTTLFAESNFEAYLVEGTTIAKTSQSHKTRIANATADYKRLLRESMTKEEAFNLKKKTAERHGVSIEEF